MFKRTKGYLLLTLLVLTGLAGRIHTETLSGKDRRVVIRELKAAGISFAQSIQSLDQKQRAFRPRGWKMSLGEMAAQHVALQQLIWNLNRQAIRNEASEKALNNNTTLYRMMRQPECLATCLRKINNQLPAEKESEVYLDLNAAMLRFVRTTTDNVRARQVSIGNEKLDAYQLLQLSAACTRYYCRLMNEARTSPGFPL